MKKPIITIERQYGSGGSVIGNLVAEKLGIKITGTVGVLLQSYSENMISSDEIKTYLDQLKNSNIRLSESLIQKTLEML